MKRFQAQILLDLVDRLSGPIKRPTQQLQMLERQVQRTDTAMDRLATGGKFVAAGAALAAPLILSFKVASDLNEALNKNAVVFGRHSREVRRWANNSSQALGLARVEALGTVGTFGNLFTSMGINRGQASGLSMDIVQLGSDLASFNNTRPQDALEALRSGLTGEIEPLRRYGINLTAAGVAQKAFAMGLTPKVMQGTDLSPSIKALATYQVILEQSKNAQGDFARTANGSANALRSIRGGVSDLAGTIGTQLEPVFNPLLLGFRNMLFAANRFAEANPFLARVLALTTLGVAALLVVIGSGIITLATFTLATAQARIGLFRLGIWFNNTTRAMTQYVTGGVATAAQTQMLTGRFATLNLTLAYTRARFMAAARAARIFTLSLLTNPVFLLIAAVVALGASFVYAWRKSEDFRAGVMRGLQPLIASWRDFVEQLGLIVPAFSRITAFIAQRLGLSRVNFDQFGGSVAYGLGVLVGIVFLAFTRIGKNVVDTFSGMLQVGRGTVNVLVGLLTGDLSRVQLGVHQIFFAIRQSVDSSLSFVQGIVSGTVGLIVRLFGGDVPKAQAVVARVFGAIRATVRTTLTGVQDFIAGSLSLIIGLFTGDLEAIRTSAAQIWRGVRGIFTLPIQLGGVIFTNLANGLNAAYATSQEWGERSAVWIGQRFRTGSIRAGELLGSLREAQANGRLTWRGVSGWLSERVEAGRIKPGEFWGSLRAGRERGEVIWLGVGAWLGERFRAAGVNPRAFLSSLRSAVTTGLAIWREGVQKWLGEQLQPPKIRPGSFFGSLREGVQKGDVIWGRVGGWLGKRMAAGKARVGDFLGSLREGKDQGGNIWARAADVLAKRIRLPSIDWSAVQTTLQGMLEHITNFGPNLVAAGEGLIGNLMTGIQNKLGDLAKVFEGIKLPDWVPGVNRGETPADRATATAGAAAPPIVNRVSTPDTMRPVVGRGVSPNITFTPEQLVKFSGVNPGSEYGKLLVQGLAQGVMTNTQVANFAVNRMGAEVEATFRRRLGIQSPSRVFMGLGSMVTQGLGRGIVGQRSLVTGAMRALAAAAVAVPITAQLGVPALGEELTIPAPTAIGRAASEPSLAERSRAESRAGAEGRVTTKTITFPNATFNLDMAGMENGMDFLKSLKGLLDGIGDE